MIYEAVCEYLQIDQTWDVEGKLPPSNSPRICITNQNRDHLEVLSEIVRQCYDIEGDDVKLRKGLELNREARKYYFNKLRSEYPVRREFAATSIEIQQSHRKFGESLTELGFSVIMS